MPRNDGDPTQEEIAEMAAEIRRANLLAKRLSDHISRGEYDEPVFESPFRADASGKLMESDN